MILPIELLDVVVRLLKDNRATLRSLTLTHRTITPFAQRQLFYHISLGGEIDDVENNDSIFRAFTDKTHSHLLSYIHSLTLRNVLGSQRRTRSSNQYIPNSLTPSFIDGIAPQLTSLNLVGFIPGWDHDDAIPLRASITRLLSSPNLTHLGLDGVHKFTMGLLNHCSSLTSFRISTPYPSYTSASNGTPSTGRIELEKLDIHFGGEIPAIAFLSWLLGNQELECKFSVSRLRMLKISGGCTNQVSTTLRDLFDICGSTLAVLSLGPGMCDFAHTSFSPLPSLHTISYTFNITYYPPQISVGTDDNHKPRLIVSGDLPFSTLVHLFSLDSAFPSGNNTFAFLDIYCRLNLLESPVPPLQVQFNTATGKAEIVKNPSTAIKYNIDTGYFDELVDILTEGKKSGRLAALCTVRVGIRVTVGPNSSPDVRAEPYVSYLDFVEAFTKSFEDLVSLPHDNRVNLEFHEGLF